MFDNIINSLKAVLPLLHLYAVAIIIGALLFQFIMGDGFDLLAIVQGVVTAVVAGITTSLFVGAIEDGS